MGSMCTTEDQRSDSESEDEPDGDRFGMANALGELGEQEEDDEESDDEEKEKEKEKEAEDKRQEAKAAKEAKAKKETQKQLAAQKKKKQMGIEGMTEQKDDGFSEEAFKNMGDDGKEVVKAKKGAKKKGSVNSVLKERRTVRKTQFSLSLQKLYFQRPNSCTHEDSLMEGDLNFKKGFYIPGMDSRKRCYVMLFENCIVRYDNFQSSGFLVYPTAQMEISHISRVALRTGSEEKFTIAPAQGAAIWDVRADGNEERNKWMMAIQTVINEKLSSVIATHQKNRKQREHEKVEKIKKQEEAMQLAKDQKDKKRRNEFSDSEDDDDY